MSDEKLEAMFRLIHQENTAIMIGLLQLCCYPKDFEKTKKRVMNDWNECFEEIVKYGKENSV